MRDTLIIFSSDNGPVLFDGYYDGAWEMNADHRPAGPWRGGKYSVWEGGTRLPLIATWPGKIKPGLSDALISQVDLYASIAALVGAEVSSGEAADSQDHLDALMGQSQTARDHVIQQGVQMTAIRMGPWKYIPPGRVRDRGKINRMEATRISPPGRLFYLPEDPAEQNDVAREYPAVLAQLRERLEAETGRKISTDSPVGNGRVRVGIPGDSK